VLRSAKQTDPDVLQELLFTTQWPLISYGFTPLGKRYGVFDRSYLSHPNIDLDFKAYDISAPIGIKYLLAGAPERDTIQIPTRNRIYIPRHSNFASVSFLIKRILGRQRSTLSTSSRAMSKIRRYYKLRGAIENDESVEIGDGYLDCIGRKLVTCDFRSRYIFVMDVRFLAMRFRPRIINRHQTVDNQGECMNVPDPMKFNS
jgi:hypothetical protein